MMLFLYRLMMPVGFLFFVPGLLWKLWRRPGYKKTFAERFGLFSSARKKEFAALPSGAVWIHAVSVGETVLALSLIDTWRTRDAKQRFVLSTTTTTGQELARKKAPEDVSVIFAPIDFNFAVRSAFNLVKPAALVILETELWPNLILEAKKRRVPLALMNARLSDHSFKGYRRFRSFFAPILSAFDVIGAQSPADAERFAALSNRDNVVITGNLKFDQRVPENLQKIDLTPCFGPGVFRILLAASTHPDEEDLVARAYLELRRRFDDLRLVIVPRHAERGGDIANILKKYNLSYVRRSLGEAPKTPVDCLLADTTGEMLRFMACADVVFMGKSLAGQNEGHNLIEPALLNKAIVTGPELRNFRFVFNVLKEAEAVAIATDDTFVEVCGELVSDDDKRRALGEAAGNALRAHAGAALRSVELVSRLFRGTSLRSFPKKDAIR